MLFTNLMAENHWPTEAIERLICKPLKSKWVGLCIICCIVPKSVPHTVIVQYSYNFIRPGMLYVQSRCTLIVFTLEKYCTYGESGGRKGIYKFGL